MPRLPGTRRAYGDEYAHRECLRAVWGQPLKPQDTPAHPEGSPVYDLTKPQGVIGLMSTSRTMSEWTDNTIKVQMANHGAYPYFWQKEIYASGFASRMVERFDFSEEAQMIQEAADKFIAAMPPQRPCTCGPVESTTGRVQPVANMAIAYYMLNNGKRLFSKHEMDGGFSEITTAEMLDGYTADQLGWLEPLDHDEALSIPEPFTVDEGAKAPDQHVTAGQDPQTGEWHGQLYRNKPTPSGSSRYILAVSDKRGWPDAAIAKRELEQSLGLPTTTADTAS